MQDIEAEVRELVRAVYEVRRRLGRDWVSWNSVARHQTGTAERASYLSSIAALPKWRHLFVATEHSVKLTDEGLELARSLDKESKSTTQLIADAVISYARNLRPIVLDVKDVSIVAKVGNKIVHAIFVELTDEVLPTETPVEVRFIDRRPIPGKLVGQEPGGDVLYVACDTDILPAESPNKLVIDRAYLLALLADQLRGLEALPERMLAMYEPLSSPVIAHPDSTKVADQLAQLPAPWTRFLWGPPGAGKTYALDHFVAQLLKRHPEESILLVAPSNRAVDMAVSHLRTRFAVNGLARLINERRVLRFGYPRNPDVLEIPTLLGPVNLDDLNRRVQECSREIKRIEHENRTSSELAVLRAKLLAAQEAVKDAVHEHVARCSVVATTTTLAYMPHSPVTARVWDTLIVDEVTMVPPAVCAYLASRAKKRLLLAGDPCQLGPVYEDHNGANGNSILWLKNDIFKFGRVSSGELTPEAIKTSDSRLARISAQRRCCARIWDHVSHLYPEVGNEANGSLAQNIAKLAPAPGQAVVLVDTSERRAQCEQMRSSWRNVESARIAMQVAGSLASQSPASYRIAIICPYRAQVKMLRQWIRDEQRADATTFKSVVVEAGTVHQFQGSEAEAVVFDLVDGPGRRNLGLLLRGDMGTRLVNVAISRAKGKLVVIADREWCRNADVAVHNRLLAQLIFNGVKTISPAELESFPIQQFSES